MLENPQVTFRNHDVKILIRTRIESLHTPYAIVHLCNIHGSPSSMDKQNANR